MSEFLDYGDPAAMRQRIPELEAEVERLRDANVSIRRDLQTSWEEKDRLRDENERLREELDDKRLSRYEPAYVGDLEEENERLRDDQTEKYDELADENARLRRIEGAAKTWRNRSDARALGMKDPDGTVGDALEDLRAALADQSTEEKLTPSQELMYAEDGYDEPTEEKA